MGQKIDRALALAATVVRGNGQLGQMVNTSKPSSNVGKWDEWYKNLQRASLYGDTVTYRLAAAFLADVTEVEDWGCGGGGFKSFCRARYVGVDGSKTPFADRVVDLTTYTSRVEGIVMRHVIEHNYSWKEVLDNAVNSFTRKFCLVLFTPFGPKTREVAHNRAWGVDVPDLSFCRADIEERFAGLRWELFDNIATDTQYGVEHVYLVWRPGNWQWTRAWKRLRDGNGTLLQRRRSALKAHPSPAKERPS
jgi:hypothetical protein